MVLNTNKYRYIVHTLVKHGWGYYKKEKDSVIYWVDPQFPQAPDYRTKFAYIKLRERTSYDGQDA